MSISSFEYDPPCSGLPLPPPPAPSSRAEEVEGGEEAAEERAATAAAAGRGGSEEEEGMSSVNVNYLMHGSWRFLPRKKALTAAHVDAGRSDPKKKQKNVLSVGTYAYV